MTAVDVKRILRPTADIEDLSDLDQEWGYVTRREIAALAEERGATTGDIEDRHLEVFPVASEIDPWVPLIPSSLDNADPAPSLSIDTATGDPLQLYFRDFSRSSFPARPLLPKKEEGRIRSPGSRSLPQCRPRP